MAGMYPSSTPNQTQLFCSMCGGDDIACGDDGTFSCNVCGTLVEDVIDTGVADEDFVDKGPGGDALYKHAYRRQVGPGAGPALNPTPLSFVKMEDPPADAEFDTMGPTEPADFGSKWRGAAAREEDYCRVIRRRYLVGVQMMLQLQCEILVEKFKVNPLICGIAGSIWVRFVASTNVYDDGWADRAVVESESQGERRVDGRKRYYGEPRNVYNERMVLVWCRTLKKTIPLSCSLAIAFLACHVAREPILPTDIVRWSIEGRIPYFTAFTDIEKLMGKLDGSIKNIQITVQMIDGSIMRVAVSIDKPSLACPLSAMYMFRPSQSVSSQKLEKMAASIAESVGLILPPVNFYAIACRYLKQLHLPVEKILPYACRMYEWSMPAESWLSTNESKLPTRVCVMSILIVAIRILYNINGLGKWEKSLSASNESSRDDDPNCESNAKDDTKEGSCSSDQGEGREESTSFVHKFESDAVELLHNLEKRYNEMNDRHEHSKGLPRYLEYCRDVIFAGSSQGDEKEEEFIEKLWDFYQKNRENVETAEKLESSPPGKRAKVDDEMYDTPMDVETSETLESSPPQMSDDTQQNPQAHQTQPTTTSSSSQLEPSNQSNNRDTAIRHLKVDMEEHRFCYLPPREHVKRDSYFLYVRKKDDGSFAYVAHADYYIVLRACAKAAQVDVRVLHIGVLTLERRLGWIEKKIDHCLQQLCLKDQGTSDSDATDSIASLIRDQRKSRYRQPNAADESGNLSNQNP